MAVKKCDYSVTALIIIIIVTSAIICIDSISIDGQITVIKNDCYERMAIGEKLSPKQTYKTFEHNTVSKCEKECTQEKETCRAYSFGIGPKGNATCLLSRTPVKETIDLKPIGTISDTDYDLYIKKLDCHIVVEPPQQQPWQTPITELQNVGGKPLPNSNQMQQNVYGTPEHHHILEQSQSAQSNHYNSLSRPTQDQKLGYHYNKPNNHYSGNIKPPQTEPSKDDRLHHVQTIVSIASGPQSILHPIHDILVSEDLYGQRKPSLSPPKGSGYGDMPPFRPSALNHPYDDHHHKPSSAPQTDYGNYDNLRPSFGYGYGYGYGYENQGYLNDNRPNNFNAYLPLPDNDRPDPDYKPGPTKLQDYQYGNGGSQLMIDRRKYESINQFNSFESEVHRYGPEHPKQYDPNYNFYDHYEKPNLNYFPRYGSVIPHPSEYNKPDNHYDYLFKPHSNLGYEEQGHRPPIGYDRPDDRRPSNFEANSWPNRPSKPEYDRRPLNNVANSGYETPNEPLRPELENSGHNQGFDEQRPGFGGEAGYNKPLRPDQTHNKIPPNSYQQPSPYGDSSSSRPPSTELSNHYGGIDYINKHYGKPGENFNLKGEGGGRKIVTESIGYDGEKITSIITELKNGK